MGPMGSAFQWGCKAIHRTLERLIKAFEVEGPRPSTKTFMCTAA